MGGGKQKQKSRKFSIFVFVYSAFRAMWKSKTPEMLRFFFSPKKIKNEPSFFAFWTFLTGEKQKRKFSGVFVFVFCAHKERPYMSY